MNIHTIANTDTTTNTGTLPYPILRVSDAAAQTLHVEPCPADQLERFEATMDARHYLQASHPNASRPSTRNSSRHAPTKPPRSERA